MREFATRNSVGECLIGIVFASDLTSTLVDSRSRGVLDLAVQVPSLQGG